MLPTIIGAAQRERLVLAARDTLYLPGEVWECGVFRGGSADHLLGAINGKTLRLFDTFGSGVPISGKEDGVGVGRFDIPEKDYITLREHFAQHPNVHLHRGVIPDTFAGLEQCAICLAHLDVDVAQTYAACLSFVWPRLAIGGIVVLDDYMAIDCAGATTIIDQFAAAHSLTINRTKGWGGWIQKS